MLTFAEIIQKAEEARERVRAEYNAWRMDELWADPATWEYEQDTSINRPTENAVFKKNYSRTRARLYPSGSDKHDDYMTDAETDWHRARNAGILPLRELHARRGLIVQTLTDRQGVTRRLLVPIDTSR